MLKVKLYPWNQNRDHEKKIAFVAQKTIQSLTRLLSLSLSIDFAHNYPRSAGTGSGVVSTSHTDDSDHKRIPCGVHSFSTFYKKDEAGNWIMKEHDPIGYGLVLDDLGIEIASRSGDSTFFASQFLSHHNKLPVSNDDVPVPRSSLVTFCSEQFISGLSLKLQMVCKAKEAAAAKSKAAKEEREQGLQPKHPNFLPPLRRTRKRDGKATQGRTTTSKGKLHVEGQQGVQEVKLLEAWLGIDGRQDEVFAKFRALRESEGTWLKQ